MADNGFRDRAYNYFLQQGYSPHAIAALVGNAMHESNGGDPTSVQPGGPGRGIFQWSADDRYKKLQAYASERGLDPNSELAQLHFADYELQNGPEKASGVALGNAQNYGQAQAAVQGYLRPQNYDPNNPSQTIHYAQRYNEGAGMAGVPTIPVPIGAGPGANAPPVEQAGLLDPRTAGDADLAGYNNPGGTAVQPESAGTVGPGKDTDWKGLGTASGEVTKAGIGLLAASGPKNTDFGGPAPQAHMPDGKNIPLPNYTQGAQPDFMKLLAQQRLQRRM